MVADLKKKGQNAIRILLTLIPWTKSFVL